MLTSRLPRSSTLPETERLTPSPKATIVTTEKTPMMIPSKVNKLRVFAREIDKQRDASILEDHHDIAFFLFRAIFFLSSRIFFSLVVVCDKGIRRFLRDSSRSSL
jgi:hypothetical protein